MKHITTKKALLILSVIAVLGSISLFVLVKSKKQVSYVTETAKIGNIIQTVSETGTVKSANELNLSFFNSGKIDKLYISVGDKVKRDDLLVELDYSGLILSKKEAQANLDVAQQSLNKLLAGATAEDIAIANANLQQAKTSYDAAVNESNKTKQVVNENISQTQKRVNDLESHTSSDITTYEQAIATAETNLNNSKMTYQKSVDNYRDSALTTLDDKNSKANVALDLIVRTLNDEDGKTLIGINNRSTITAANNSYAEAIQLLTEADASLAQAKSDNRIDYVVDALADGSNLLNKVLITLDNCYNALEASVTSSNFTQTELDSLKTNISAQQVTIGAAIASLQSSKQSYDSAILAYSTNIASAQENLNQAKVAYENALSDARNALATAKLLGDQQITTAETRVSTAAKTLQVSQAQLNKTMARPTTYDISLTQAKLRQAQAALDTTNKQIENSKITAPIDGTISKVNFLVGEQISPVNQVISMLGANNFEIEVLISEADIAKIKIGNKVEITLDAFGDEVKFKGAVVFIEPAETVIQDVIYYKVKVNFDPAGENVKSGMTANVTIVTAEHNNVLMIPSRTVVQKNGQGKIVRVLKNNQVEERAVNLGLAGDEGLVEVVSGLNNGDVVITQIKKK